MLLGGFFEVVLLIRRHASPVGLGLANDSIILIAQQNHLPSKVNSSTFCLNERPRAERSKQKVFALREWINLYYSKNITFRQATTLQMPTCPCSRPKTESYQANRAW